MEEEATKIVGAIATALKPKLLPLVLFLIIGLHDLARCAAVDVLSPSGELCGGRSRSTAEQKVQISNVGVVVDMGSWTGKNVRSCMAMAICEFYASHGHYKNRLVMDTRDSMGDPTRAISSALHLLKHTKVQALLVVGLETKSLAAIANKAKVPIFSLASTFLSSPAAEYPFLIQINQDQVSEFKGIASIVSRHKWRSVAVLYEDSDDGKDSIPFFVGSLEDRSIRVSHLIAISPFAAIDDELHELAVTEETIFIVHMSPSLSSRLFLTAKRKGLMKEGYAWLVTSKTMNQLQSMDGEVVESMQGVVGFKTHIPLTRKLRDFSFKWRNQFYRNNPDMDSREVDVLGIRAYDTIWALAESIENLGTTHRGLELLEEISERRFKGLSGQFQILDGRLRSELFSIVNLIGKQGRRVGFWTPKDGIVKEIPQYLGTGRRGLSSSTARKMAKLEAIIWPGVTTIAPRGLFMLTRGKKLRIAVPINKGFKQFASFEADFLTNKTTFKGFSIDVFQAAINSLDYQYQIQCEFIPYNGSYNDLVIQVYHQEYDGIVGDLTILASRSSFVDFTVSYTDVGIGTITKREINDIWLFAKPFSLDLWFASAALCVLMGVVVWFIEHSSSNQEFRGSVSHQIGTMLWFGFSTLFYAHRENLRSNLSRMVVIVWLFVVLILTSTYTATLSSMLTLQKIRLASAKDDIGIQYNNPWVRGTIVNNMNFTAHKFPVYDSPEQYADALSNGSVGAIVDEIPYLKIFLAKYGARYAMVSSQPDTAGFGFAFQKKYASLVSDLSQAIMKLREQGKLATMEKTWFNSESLVMPEENTANTPSILNLDNFDGLFLISLSCCVFVFLVRLGSIFLKHMNYLDGMITVIRDKGILAYLLKKVASRSEQIQQN